MAFLLPQDYASRTRVWRITARSHVPTNASPNCLIVPAAEQTKTDIATINVATDIPPNSIRFRSARYGVTDQTQPRSIRRIRLVVAKLGHDASERRRGEVATCP
jgi:hypothetical protein